MLFTALGVDETGAAIGTHTITATVQADANGRGWNGPFTIEIAGADGKTLASVAGTVTATPTPASR